MNTELGFSIKARDLFEALKNTKAAKENKYKLQFSKEMSEGEGVGEGFLLLFTRIPERDSWFSVRIRGLEEVSSILFLKSFDSSKTADGCFQALLKELQKKFVQEPKNAP